MSTLSRYLNRVVAVRFVIVLFAITGFAALLDLLEVADSFAKIPGGPTLAALRYLGLRLPMIVAELLPLAALLAGILAVGDLLRHRELVVVWGAGLSTLRVLRLLLPACLVLLGAKLALDDLAVPRVAGVLRAWGVGEFKVDTTTGMTGGDWYWLRSGADIIRISAADAAAGQLRRVSIFERDGQGLLLTRIDAATARSTPDGLLLSDVVRSAVGEGGSRHMVELSWPDRLDLDRVKLLATPPRELSFAQLLEILRAGAYGARPSQPYATALYARLAGAFVPALLLVLAFALGRRFSRTGNVAPILIQAVIIGFAAIILTGASSALGEIGFLTPALAACLPVLLLAAVVLGLAGSLRGLRPKAA